MGNRFYHFGIGNPYTVQVLQRALTVRYSPSLRLVPSWLPPSCTISTMQLRIADVICIKAIITNILITQFFRIKRLNRPCSLHTQPTTLEVFPKFFLAQLYFFPPPEL